MTTPSNFSDFSEALAAGQSRLESLNERAAPAGTPRGLLPDALEELHTTIEELRVAEEEMRAQNEELMRTRQRVEAERQRYQELFQGAPDGYLITTWEGRILEANLAASRLLNIAPRFLKSRPLAGSVYQEDLRDFHTRMAALAAAREQAFQVTPTQEWTLRLRRRRLDPFHASLTVAPIPPQPDEPANLRWIIRDVTERRKVEEERLALAREQAARMEAEAGQRQVKAILETITDIFVTLDRDWRFTYLNASAARLCRAVGKDPDALLGKVIWDEFPAALGTAFQSEGLRAAETQETTEFIEFVRGLNLWFQVRVFPSDTSIVAYAQDVTARQEVEDARRAAYEKDRRIAETLQRTLLRTVPPESFPPLTIETFYEAALNEAQIGGDFFDVFAFGENQIALVVGDVSGKGLAAAEMTAEVKYALRVFLRETRQPSLALARLNEFVCDALQRGDLSSDRLVALALTTIALETGETVIATAGGEPPLILRRNGTMETARTEGLLLGVQPGIVYTASTATLAPGDTLLMFTDGITEARRAGDLLGIEGLQRLTEEARDCETVRGTGEVLMNGARAYAGGALQDDACLLLARWQ